MIDEILKDMTHRMEQSLAHTQGELNKVRTGRANPEMFNSLGVDYYGSMTPCLLYTSPSPRDLSTSRMPSSA